jgi:hypothetical protein
MANRLNLFYNGAIILTFVLLFPLLFASESSQETTVFGVTLPTGLVCMGFWILGAISGRVVTRRQG